MSSAFQQAWDLLKAPWNAAYVDEGNQRMTESETVTGPLYSGGDRSDDFNYWTPDKNEALNYALYGSAVGAKGIPMRETHPAIKIAPDPGYDEHGNPASFLDKDRQSLAYIADQQEGIDSEFMDEDELHTLINSKKEQRPEVTAYGTRPIGDNITSPGSTTGSHFNNKQRAAHRVGALDRLREQKSGIITLPNELMGLGGTSETDRLDAMDYEDISESWDSLDDWERRYLFPSKELRESFPSWILELLKAEMSMAERTLHPGDSVAGWAERNIPDDFAASGEFFDDENSRIDWDEPSDKSTSPAFPVNFSPKEATDPAFKPVIEEMQRRLRSDLDWFQNKRGMEEEFREAYVNSVNPWGDDFPMTAREVENVDLGNVDLDTVPPLNQYPHIRSRKGRYFTKLPVHGVADKDKDRGTVDDEFSFQGVPFNEETHFTTGEPMDIAWRLLKDDDSRTHSEAVGEEEGGPDTYKVEDEAPCFDCGGSGLDPEPDWPGEECSTCDGAGTLAGVEETLPGYLEHHGVRAGKGKDDFTTGEPMDMAWRLLKATDVSPPQWGKTFREEGFDEEGVYFPKEDESWIHPSNIYQAWKNSDFTPTVWGEGKEGQGRKDLSMINRLLGVDAHEDTHRAMSQIGEEYESGLHEEYAPMLSQNLIEARNPEGLQSQDYRQKLMGGGMSPEQAAIEATKLGAKFGFGHPAVREPPESSILEKPEDIKFYTGYGKNASEPMDMAWQLLKWQSPLRDKWGKKKKRSRFGSSYGGFGIPRVLQGEGDLSRVHSTSLTSQNLSGHEKALMEHGPITHYHGTYAMDKVFGDKGLKARPMPEHRAVGVPEELQGESLVFTTTNWDEANDWAQQRGEMMGADPGNVGVIGIRGQNLDFMERPDSEKTQFSTVDIHQGDIPHENLVEFTNRPFR